MKPINLHKSSIRLTKINDYLISSIEVDLTHVNHGLDDKKQYRKQVRSAFTLNDVIAIFEALDGLVMEPQRDDKYEYYAVEKDFFLNNKRCRVIFCIELINDDTAGIISIYVVKRGRK